MVHRHSVMTSVTLILLALVMIDRSESYNILSVMPGPSYSHQQPCVCLGRILAKRGHNVTAIVANPNLYEPIPNYREIDVSSVYDAWSSYQTDHDFSLQTKLPPLETFNEFSYIFAHMVDAMYQDKKVQELIRSKDTKYDLILYDGLFPAALGLVHHFNYPPAVVFSPLSLYSPLQHVMGNPINPSHISSFLLGNSDRMTFFERVQNTIFICYELYIIYTAHYPSHNKVARKYFGNDLPLLEDLEKNTSLFLLNGDLSSGYPMPLQPNTILFGTVHTNVKQKPLPKDLKKWMDEAEDGVIYFSLGSNMKGVSVPEEKRNAFVKAFSRFPKTRIVWKWESDVEFPGKPSNVLLRKWLPQQSILAHPKTKLFISQGGQESRQEAINFAVPVLTVPMFWDQAWNGKKLEVAGAGLSMDFYEISDDDVYSKIKALLTEKSYKENMDKLSELSKDKPISHEDTVGWWIEYVIRHKGAPHLRPAVQDLKWYQYTLLDVAAFLLSVIFITLYIIYFIIKKVFYCLSNNGRKKLKPE